MSNKKKTTSITEAISAAIEVDPVLNLKALIHLIKDTTTEVVHKDKASEKKKKENEKAKKKQRKRTRKINLNKILQLLILPLPKLSNLFSRIL